MAENLVIPIPGDLVYYKLGNEWNRPGELRPAMIVRVWSDTTVNLLIFVDGDNDKFMGAEGWETVPSYTAWKTSVPRIENVKEGSGAGWFYPEIVWEPVGMTLE